MTPAYDKVYLGDAALALGSMLESVVYLFGVELETYWRHFLSSHVSEDFAHGLSGTVSGKSGWELAVEILEAADVPFEKRMPRGRTVRSREFWAGWALAQYQWHSGLLFAQIEQFAPLKNILLMYSPYHEMDIGQFFDALDRARAPESTRKTS